MHVVVDEEAVVVDLAQPPRHRHRLGGGGGLVEQRGVGDVEPGQAGDHRLEVEQRLQPSLADLRLVRRVGGVPGRVLEHVATDHGRRVGAVVAHPDQARHRRDPGGVGAQRLERLWLAQCSRQRQRLAQADRIRDGLVDQRRQARHAELVEHAIDVVGSRADVPGFEAVVQQRGERGWFCDAVDVIRQDSRRRSRSWSCRGRRGGRRRRPRSAASSPAPARHSMSRTLSNVYSRNSAFGVRNVTSTASTGSPSTAANVAGSMSSSMCPHRLLRSTPNGISTERTNVDTGSLVGSTSATS